MPAEGLRVGEWEMPGGRDIGNVRLRCLPRSALHCTRLLVVYRDSALAVPAWSPTRLAGLSVGGPAGTGGKPEVRALHPELEGPKSRV